MTESEAKEAIRDHFQGNTSNVRRFLDALEVAERINGEMTLEELEKWGNENDQSNR